jgi:hypothetical protein
MEGQSEAQHSQVVKEVLDWLDKYQGMVQR